MTFAVIVMATMVVATACTSSTGGTGKGTTAPSLSGRAFAEQQSLQAYRGMWAAYAKAGLTANPNEPDLALYASADALKVLTSGLAAVHDAGQVIRGDLVTNPSVKDPGASPDPTRIDLVDCLDSSRFLIYVAATGALADDKPGGRRAVTAIVDDVGGNHWKVTSFAARAVGTC